MDVFSYDLLNLGSVEQIDFGAWRYNRALNLPGGFSCDIAANDPRATTEFLAKARHGLFFADGGVIRAQGIIWDRRRSQDLQTLTVGGQGIFSYFRDGKRQLRDDYPPGGSGISADQFQHVTVLMAIAQSEAGTNLGMDVRYHPGLSGKILDLTFNATERKQFGQIIEDLASTDDGFDFAISSEWVDSKPALHLDLYTPQQGTVLETAWEVGTHVNLAATWDESTSANRIDAIGATVNGHPLIGTASRPPLDQLRVDKVVSYTAITDQAQLDAQAKGQRKREATPQATVKVVIADHEEAGLGTYDLGDTVTLVARFSETEMLAAPYRIMADEVVGDVNGAVTVTVDLVPA